MQDSIANLPWDFICWFSFHLGGGFVLTFLSKVSFSEILRAEIWSSSTWLSLRWTKWMSINILPFIVQTFLISYTSINLMKKNSKGFFFIAVILSRELSMKNCWNICSPIRWRRGRELLFVWLEDLAWVWGCRSLISGLFFLKLLRKSLSFVSMKLPPEVHGLNLFQSRSDGHYLEN